MQFFTWESKHAELSWWKHFEREVSALNELGVTQVWLPPPNKAMVPVHISILTGVSACSDDIDRQDKVTMRMIWYEAILSLIACDRLSASHRQQWDLGEFDQKGSTSTRWGSKDDLLAAVTAAKACGIDVLIDAVLNVCSPQQSFWKYASRLIAPL